MASAISRQSKNQGSSQPCQTTALNVLPVRSFWLYEMPPKTSVNPNTQPKIIPCSLRTIICQKPRRAASPDLLSFCDPVYRFRQVWHAWTSCGHRHPRPTKLWPAAWRNCSSILGDIGRVFGPVQLFTHDSLNYEDSTVSDRQAVIAQSSSWLNVNGVRHVFMDDLGDYIYARTKSTLTRASFDGSQIRIYVYGFRLQMQMEPSSLQGSLC